MSENGRKKALDTALASLTKRFGDGAIMRLGEATHLDVEVIPTGSLTLDVALGVGGIPRGRVTEIYGPEGAGKTTVAQHIVAEAQKLGGVTAFIDMEHALDPTYAAACGVNVDDLYISQPDTGEQALEIAETLVRSGAVDVVIVDSVAALVPRRELEGEMGDSHPGLQARLMSQALRKLSGAIKQSNTAMIFTNQLRMKIGVMFGSPETTSGGRALKFYASVRLDVRRIAAIKDKGEAIGNRTRIRVTKNKVAPPFRVAEFDIIYGEGISREGDILDLAVEHDVVDKRGAYYNYGDERMAQGRENAKEFMRENPEITAAIEQDVRSQFSAEDLEGDLTKEPEEDIVALEAEADELPEATEQDPGISEEPAEKGKPAAKQKKPKKKDKSAAKQEEPVEAEPLAAVKELVPAEAA